MAQSIAADFSVCNYGSLEDKCEYLVDMVISDERIMEFRDLVNSNSDFVYKKYSDIDGQNHWNLICSCMDWITVSVRYLQNAEVVSGNVDVSVMQMFSLISSIDLLSESINQLHRVFINPKTIPFVGDKICFLDRLFVDEDDNRYFKSIRAAFGAHPVNLNHASSKRFASWPFDSHINSGDLIVILYSNQVNEDVMVMNLKSKELMRYLAIRYNYLDVISNKINEIFSDYKVDLKKYKIERKSNCLEQLQILRAESEKRFDNDYYNGVIDDLIMIFEADASNCDIESIVKEYRKSLKKLIDEIADNLQAMNIVNLENDSLIDPDSELRKKLSYELGKFYSWIHNAKYDPLVGFYLERFNKESNFKFNFSIDDPVELLFLKSKLMILY